MITFDTAAAAQRALLDVIAYFTDRPDDVDRFGTQRLAHAFAAERALRAELSHYMLAASAAPEEDY